MTISIDQATFDQLEQIPEFRQRFDKISGEMAALLRSAGYRAEYVPGIGLSTNATPTEMARVLGADDNAEIVDYLIGLGQVDESSRKLVEAEIYERVAQLTNRQAIGIFNATIISGRPPESPGERADEKVIFSSQPYIDENGEKDYALTIGSALAVSISVAIDEPDNPYLRKAWHLLLDATDSNPIPPAFRR
jgi:hypothetical protein